MHDPKVPSQYLLVQNQQWKHQNNVWNLVSDVVLVFLFLILNIKKLKDQIVVKRYKIYLNKF